MMYKKGQGISLNVIIIAAIALLVLVILSVIFMGRIGIFTRESAGTEYCVNTVKGSCGSLDFDGSAIPCGEGTTKVGTCNNGEHCCRTVV